MMMGWDFGWGWGTMMFGGLMMLVVWGGLIALVVLLVRAASASPLGGLARDGRNSESSMTPPHQTPLELLQSRYAKGEIGREEYEAIRHDLQTSSS